MENQQIDLVISPQAGRIEPHPSLDPEDGKRAVQDWMEWPGVPPSKSRTALFVFEQNGDVRTSLFKFP